MDWLAIDTKMRFYFGQSLAEMTLPVLKSRVAFLYGDTEEGGGQCKSGSNAGALAAAATAAMDKTGRNSVPLADVIGVI